MQDQLSRLGIAIACALLAMLLALGAVGLLGAALYLVLMTVVSPPAAAALTAAAALLLATLVLLVGRAMSRRRASPAGRRGPGAGLPGPMGVIGSLGREMGQEAGALARAHSGKAILAALAAGFVVGVSPGLRRSLWRLLQ